MKRGHAAPPRPEDLWSQFENVNGWIRHADAKLATLIAFIGVAGGGLYVIALGPAQLWIKIVIGAAGLVLSAAALLAFLGLLPRRPYRPSSVPDRIYFRAIANSYTGPDDYVRAVLNAGPDISANLARQIYANSLVADRKFVLASWATFLLLIALALLAISAASRMFA